MKKTKKNITSRDLVGVDEVKEVKPLRKFSFPNLSLTVEAASYAEALKEAKKIISKRESDN